MSTEHWTNWIVQGDRKSSPKSQLVRLSLLKIVFDIIIVLDLDLEVSVKATTARRVYLESNRTTCIHTYTSKKKDGILGHSRCWLRSFR